MTRDRRYVIPFPNGITIPTEPYTETEHDKKLTFPSTYQPAIMSALKVLARPETYQADNPTDLDFAVQQGMDILGNVGSAPCVDLIPNWRGYLLASGDYSAFTQIPLHSSTVKVTYYAFFSYIADTENDLNNLAFYFGDDDGDAGGEFDLYLTVYPSGRVYDIDTWDCLGAHVHNTSVVSGSNLVLSYTNMKNVYLYFQHTSVVFGTLKLMNDAVCSNA